MEGTVSHKHLTRTFFKENLFPLAAVQVLLLLSLLSSNQVETIEFPSIPQSEQGEVPKVFTLRAHTDSPRWRDVDRKILEAYADVCGDSRLCNVTMFGSKYARNERCSVCETCYCDDVCWAYKDCCLDKVISDTLLDQLVNETEPGYGPLYHECADLRVKGIVQTELKDLWKQRLISKCPERFANPQAKSECEGTGPINKDVYSLDVSPDQLSRNWPVASTRSLLFYKNQACAKCHEDDQEGSLVFWGLRLSCEESPGLPISSDPSTILALVLRSPRCEVVFTTPVTMEPRECQFAHAGDPEKIIQQCNATGQRSQYDGVLWRSCQVFSAVSKLDEQVFINPFCFRCQTDGIKDFRPPCPYGGSVPFFIVLSPDALESAQNDRASFDCRCKNGYIYNPYKETCRKVHCATGRRLVDDACVSTVSSGNGQGYSLSLSLTTPWLDTSNEPFPPDPDTFKQVSTQLKEVFVDKIKDCAEDSDITVAHLRTFMVHMNQVTEMGQNFTVSFHAEIELIYPQSQEEFEQNLYDLYNQSWKIKILTLNASDDLSMTPAGIQKPNTATINGLRDVISTWYYTDSDGTNRTAYLFVYISVNPVRSVYGFAGNGYDVEETMSYVEVKNTLMCPHFVYNLTNSTELRLEKDTQLPWPHDIERITHVETGVKLSIVDFSYTPDGLIIICVDKIREKMKAKYDNEDRDAIDGVDEFGDALMVTSHICLTISLLCLTLTLVTYCLFPVLRTLPGKNTMSLVATLLLTIVLFTIGGFVEASSLECQAIGVATHFFLLSTFVWMFLCSTHMYRVFSHIMEHPAAAKEDTGATFRVYMVTSMAIPALIVLSTILANHFLANSSDFNHNSEPSNSTFKEPDEIAPVFDSCQTSAKARLGYGHGVCYLSNKPSLLLAGVLPILLTCAANLAIFILTVLAFRRLSVQEKAARHEARGHILINLKLSTLTGINWLPCTVAAFVSSPIVWYSFLVLCGLQGLYVFLSFVCNKRVLELYRQRFAAHDAGSTSSGRNRGGGRPENKSDSSMEKYRNAGTSATGSTGHTTSSSLQKF